MFGLMFALQAAGAVPPAARQIELAVEAAPKEYRETATVIGYGKDGKQTTLRKGTGLMVCLADDPKQKGLHVSCYHKDLDPFMAIGRTLRAKGMGQGAVDSARLAQLEAGTLKMPKFPTMLYQIMADEGDVDAASGKITKSRKLTVVYIPYATAETTGLSEKPGPGPWLMEPGTPWAHIMISS